MRAGVTSVLTALVLSLLPAMAATAATVYEIDGRWADGTPSGPIASGDVLSAEWRVNINDDAAAPANEPVDDVTFTTTVTNGRIASIPDLCLVDGVATPSSISADGKTLSCNIGTQNQGTAVVVTVPIRVDGATGDSISMTSEIEGQSVDLSPIPIKNKFGLDIRWGTPVSNLTYGTGYVDANMQWTLAVPTGSDPGPSSVSYNLTIAVANGSVTSAAPAGCDAFVSGPAPGHPWSGGAHPAESLAPFVGSCTLVKTGATTYRLTLNGIDYSRVQVPTEDSQVRPLPANQQVVASGQITIRVNTTTNTSLSLSSNAPTYTSPNGQTATDDATNNTSNKAIVFPGSWSSRFAREPAHMNTGGTSWDDSIRIPPGAKVVQLSNGTVPQNAGAIGTWGTCSVLDTKYVEYVSKSHTVMPGSASFPVGGSLQWYVGNDATVNPASSTYNPANFNCGQATGWVNSEPTDLTTVKAMRLTFPAAQNVGRYYVVFIEGKLKNDVAAGQDVWQFGNRMFRDSWQDMAGGGASITPTPDARYPYTSGFRDILRVVVATPAVEKSVDRSVVRPGVPAVYTLTYSANGAGSQMPPTVDGFQLVDTLPLGLSYVPGSANPAPTTGTDGQGRQVLSWSLNSVPTNTQNALTYQAITDPSVEPGAILENSVTAAYGGITTAPDTAQVTVSTSGTTTIGKTTDQWFIANPDGSGDGDGSWTVTLRSQDPLPQEFTDTIDVLPYNGDGRGTSFSGSYEVTSVDAPAGAVVYYTAADPATLSDDPNAASNGAAGDPSGNTAGWSTTRVANPTAIRVIGGKLAPGAAFAFTVNIATDGAEPGDVWMNRAQGVGEHTELVMRTSEPLTMGTMYSASLKKYVKGTDGEWHDANTVEDYPTYRVGDEVPYRIVIQNTGQGTLRDLTITDDLFPAGSFTVDELAPDAKEVHEFTVTLTGGGSVVNTACGAAAMPDDSEVAPTINCDPAGVEVVNYTTVKSSDPASGTTLYPGDEVTYTITVTQAGTVPAVAQFTDDLAEVLDDADLTGGPTASTGTATITDGVLSWNGTVPIGEAATVTYTVTIKDSAALADGGSYFLENGVTSPGCAEAGCPPLEHPIADYSVVKSSDPRDGSNVKVGDTIEYTLKVTQIGKAPYKGASLTDDLTDVLDDATWDDELNTTAGTVDFDDASRILSWTGDLAMDQVVTITYTVTVTGEGDTHLRNVVTSDGCVSTDGCETEHYTATYTTVKTSDPGSGANVQIGDVITYTVTVTQSGAGRVVGQFFNDDLSKVLDDATFNDDIVASMGTFTYANGKIAWSGELGPNDVATVTYSVTVTAAGDTLIGNTVKSPGCESAGDCQTEHRTGRYETVKTSDPVSGSDVQIGDTIDYTVTVTQIGEAPVDDASFTDDLTAVLDDATWNDDLDASKGTAGYTEPTVTWSGDLAVDDVVTVTYSVTVTGAGDQTLTNVVTSDGCVDEGSCTTTHQTGDYTVSKTSVAAPGTDVAVGDTITYTITVAQRGPGSIEGASFDDDLAAVLDDATWNDDLNATAGTASFDADTEKLAWSGDLALGAVVTVTYSVTVTGAGDMTLANVAVPGENGECVPASDGNPDCTTTHETGRFTYSKMADPAHNSDVQAGDVVTYTVTVNQVGPAAVAASLSDDLSDVIDDATYNGDVAATAGTAVVDGPALSWSGSMAPGDVVTITYSVTVTGAGNTTLANVVTSPSPAGECVTAEDGTEDCRTIHKTGGYVYSKTSDPDSGVEVHSGETVTYTLSVTQRGDGRVAGAIITDDLTEVLDDARWNDDAIASTGTVSRDGNTLTWTGDLAVGQIVTVTYSVTVTADGPAELRNVVTSPDERAICNPEGVCTTTHKVTPHPSLAITGVASGWTASALAVLLLLLAGGTAIMIDRRRRSRTETAGGDES